MIFCRTRLPIPKLVAILRSSALRRRVLIGTVAGLACLHLMVAVASVRHKSAAFDEIAHITAGCSYWARNDYRLHPENGILPQRWMTLPLILCSADLRFPEPNSEDWHRSDVWRLGDEFFHRSGNDVESILLVTRSAVAVVSVLLCVLVFFWSRRTFGNLGGLISLLLCSLSPTVLAHGQLATSDLFATFFFAAAVWSVWELLHRVSAGRLLAGAFAVSGLFLCKTSAVLILPMAVLMALISLIPRQCIVVRLPTGQSRELTSQWSRRGCVFAVTLLIGLAAYSSVWAAYGFRYAASAENDHEFYKFGNIDTAAQCSGNVGKAVKWLADRHVLPEAYLYGAAFVAAHEERPAFLNGEYSTTGWRHFFPYCLAVKTPLATFGLLALGMIGLPFAVTCRANAVDKRNSRWASMYQMVPIAVALLVLWSVVLTSRLNIGHRHLLPTYPFMFVLAGAAARWCGKGTRVASGTVALLLIWLVADSLASYPHYLSYFNQCVPRAKAYQHLVDSNLDWGQDLPSLKTWLDDNTGDDEPVFLGYFGTASPAYYGIDAQPLPLIEKIAEPLELRPGTYCFCATCLQAVYGFAPGRWNRQYETRYQALTWRFAKPDNGVDAELRSEWDALRARRLTAHLRHRDPDDQVGYSILIYRLSNEELAEALNGPPAELDPLCWALQRAATTEPEGR